MPALIQLAESKSSDNNKNKCSKDKIPRLVNHNQEENKNHIANISRPRVIKKKINIPQVSCNSVCVKNGVWKEFLGLFNTRSTNSLLSKEIVVKYKMKLVKDNGVWR